MALRKRILLLSTALFLCGVSLSSCGGNDHAQMRFADACPDVLTNNVPSNVDVAVDGATVITNLAFPSTNGSYLAVTAGNRDIEVRKTGTTTDLVNAVNVNFNTHDQYTLFFTGLTTANPPTQTVDEVRDDNSPPASGNIKLRFFHASPSVPLCPAPDSLPCVDIYVVAPGTNINGLQPTIPSLAYQQASGYLNIAAASYEIIVTNLGSKTPLIDDTPPAFTAGQIRTFVVLDAPKGGLPPSLLELADLN